MSFGRRSKRARTNFGQDELVVGGFEVVGANVVGGTGAFVGATEGEPVIGKMFRPAQT